MPLKIILDECSRDKALWRALQQHLNDNEHLHRDDIMRVGGDGAPGCNTPDNELLIWCAEHGRVIVTQDKRTMIPEFYRKVDEGYTLPGMLIIEPDHPVREIADYLVLLMTCYSHDDLQNRYEFMPPEQ